MTGREIEKTLKNARELAKQLDALYYLSVKVQETSGPSGSIGTLVIEDSTRQAPSIKINLLENKGVIDISFGPFYFVEAEGHSNSELASVIAALLAGDYKYRAYSLLPFGLAKRIELEIDADDEVINSDTTTGDVSIRDLW